jgi:hypothetical protein
MKKSVIITLVIMFVFILLIIFLPNHLIGLCPAIAKICSDGTAVGREGLFCKFEECPKIQVCQKNSDCNENYKCVKFPTQEKPICNLWKGFTYCYAQCGSHNCGTVGSDPIEVVCT